MDPIATLFASNQFFSGGVVLGALGLVAVWLRDVPRLVWSWGKRYFVSTLSFDSRDELMFGTLIEYMDSRDVLRGINQFTVRGVKQGDAYSSVTEDMRQGAHPQAFLSPGEGFHIFRMDGRLMWMTRELQMAQSVLEKVTLSTFGRDRRHLERFLESAIAQRVAREVNKIAIYIPNPYTFGDWARAKLGNNRRLGSIVLKAGQVEGIVGDLQQFFANRERYESLGIPWRRGYLLTGTPGTGKTSLVTALASELSLNVCALSLASAGITDEKINTLLSAVPPRSVILLEDIDSFFRSRDQATSGMKLSFSGFINALDGVAAHEGSVLFMTTNHPEKIDEAVIRSGRVDYRMELTRCNRDQLRGMFLKFFDDPDAAERFANALAEDRWSPAQVQERLLKASAPDVALGLFADT